MQQNIKYANKNPAETPQQKNTCHMLTKSMSKSTTYRFVLSKKQKEPK